MSIADKLIRAKQDLDDAYEAGQKSEYDQFWDAFQQNGERTYYRYGFSSSGWTAKTLKPKYPIKFADTNKDSYTAQFLFANCAYNESEPIDMTNVCEKIDWTNCMNATSIFDNAKCKNITIDLSNAVNLTNAFRRSGGGKLVNVRLKISNKCTNLGNAFYYFNDNTLIFMEGSEIACNGLNTQWAPLSKESIVSIFNALSSTTNGLSVTFSKSAVNTAFGINVDSESTYPAGSEYYILRHSKDNWTVNYV